MTKKVAFVYDAIYPYIKGGGERRYYEIAKCLAIKDYEVHLYGMKLWEGLDVIKKEGVYLHGICPSKSLYINDGRRSIKQAIFFGIHCLKLIKEDFDVIDCCGFPYFSLFTCKLVCLLKEKKLYSTWHEVWGNDYWNEYLGKLSIFGTFIEKVSIKLPNRIIAVSPQTANKIKADLGFKGKIAIVPNGIDIEEIKKIKPSKVKSDVIYAGRLMSFKNIDILIKAIKEIKKSHPSISCLIIGDGPEKKKLINLTKDLKLQNNIKFLGFLKNHDDVYSYMKSSKVFVLPSTREGFGIVVLEANACGIPVVTIDHEDNAAKDLINGKNGIVCRLDEKEIAGSIINLLKSNINFKDCVNFVKSYDWNQIINEV